jgi:hypothetical protein
MLSMFDVVILSKLLHKLSIIRGTKPRVSEILPFELPIFLILSPNVVNVLPLPIDMLIY